MNTKLTVLRCRRKKIDKGRMADGKKEEWKDKTKEGRLNGEKKRMKKMKGRKEKNGGKGAKKGVKTEYERKEKIIEVKERKKRGNKREEEMKVKFKARE